MQTLHKRFFVLIVVFFFLKTSHSSIRINKGEITCKSALGSISYSFHTSRALRPEYRWPNDGLPTSKFFYYINFFPKDKKTSSLQYIENWMQNRKNTQQTNHVLDLYGSGINVPLADSRTAVRFEPLKLYEDDIVEALQEDLILPHHVFADLTKNSAWKVIDASMRDRSIPHFDLVTMNPDGGWDQIIKNKEKAYQLLIKTLEEVSHRLSPTGEFFFVIRRGLDFKEFQQSKAYKDFASSRSTFFERFELKWSEEASFAGWLKPK